MTAQRQDLYTHIHQAIRLALFDCVSQAGATDWSDPAEVQALQATWRPVLALLRSHSHHEDTYITPLLGADDTRMASDNRSEHHQMDAWLDEIAGWFERLAASPTNKGGLMLYRELTLFLADYLRHLHEEETAIMGRIWEVCTDDEIAGALGRLREDTPPEVLSHAVELMLRATNMEHRLEMVRAMAAGAPPEAIDALLESAGRWLQASSVTRLRHVARVAVTA